MKAATTAAFVNSKAKLLTSTSIWLVYTNPWKELLLVHYYLYVLCNSFNKFNIVIENY